MVVLTVKGLILFTSLEGTLTTYTIEHFGILQLNMLIRDKIIL